MCFVFKTSLAKPMYGVVHISGTLFETGVYTLQQSNIAMENRSFKDVVSCWQKGNSIAMFFLQGTRWAITLGGGFKYLFICAPTYLGFHDPI